MALGDLGEPLVVDHDPVPLRAALGDRLVLPIIRGLDVKDRGLAPGCGASNLRIGAKWPDQRNLVDSSDCHFGFLLVSNPYGPTPARTRSAPITLIARLVPAYTPTTTKRTLDQLKCGAGTCASPSRTLSAALARQISRTLDVVSCPKWPMSFQVAPSWVTCR